MFSPRRAGPGSLRGEERGSDVLADAREVLDAVRLVAPRREDVGPHADGQAEGGDAERVGLLPQARRCLRVAAAIRHEHDVATAEGPWIVGDDLEPTLEGRSDGGHRLRIRRRAPRAEAAAPARRWPR